ncbi:hypothetical protein VMCG_03892 [Cytospora schulzeri]|uniref:Letm1 RBD domain-containing protein n=1 Tax=Cytospora schulzeri TaxID=448051 RepID=A0A423WVJ4_9PEZI|nr:hypothetical protein VMCG_03892 [Valsa malicola]
MISTTQLRILRTFPHTSPPNTAFRLATTSFNAPTRRIIHQQQPTLHAQHRLFSASTTSRQDSHPPRQDNDTTTTANRSTDLAVSTAAANPPPTTRPPPLNLPTRSPDTSTISHLFATGKAYLTFYKTGLRHIYINTRLVWSLNAAKGIPPDHTPAGDTATPQTRTASATTRSTELLRRRWRHDVRRLPVFALMLLVCGEFTPLVVLAVPGVVPITCRIPQQVEKLRRKAEERRGASFERLRGKYGKELCEGKDGATGEERTGTAGAITAVQQKYQQQLAPADVTTHVARSLNLVSTLWDSVPLSLLPDTFVSVMVSRKVRQHLRYLDQDNHLIHQAGGVSALEEDEVLLACEDRGIWPVGEEEGAAAAGSGTAGGTAGGGLLSSARENLRRWLYLVGDDYGLVAGRDDPWSPERAADREARMVVLMLRREWPREQTTVRTSAQILQAKDE